MEKQRVRICDIAQELGLSTATVSNVIHGKTNKVSDETVQRVMALLEQTRKVSAGDLAAHLDASQFNNDELGQLAATIHAHPTLAEIMVETAFKAVDRPLHG